MYNFPEKTQNLRNNESRFGDPSRSSYYMFILRTLEWSKVLVRKVGTNFKNTAQKRKGKGRAKEEK